MAIDWHGPPKLWDEPERSHAHLRLAASLQPQPRRKRPSGGGRGPLRYQDHGRHARDVQQQLATLRERHTARATVFGIDPDLVLVVLFNRGVSGMDDRLEAAGLRFLAATGQKAIAAFSSDPDMTDFLEHLSRYEQGVPPAGKTAHYEDLFDAIDSVRPLAPTDVVDVDVQQEIATRPPDLVIRLDLQCWCPEDEPEARRRFDETRSAIANAGGTVVDASLQWHTGLSLIRADVPSDRVFDLAATDRVRQISLLPQPLLTTPEIVLADIESLPSVVAPSQDSPIIAVIDSGVRTNHPLLSPALVDAVAIGDSIPDGSDEHGHGTLAVYLPLLAPVIAALTARHLAARMPPRLATWLLTAMAVVLARVSRAALTATALGQIPSLAAVGHWSVSALRRHDPTALAPAVAAGVLLTRAGTAAVLMVCRRIAALRDAALMARELSSGEATAVLTDPFPAAYTLPGRRGRVVVSTGMLAALDARERRIVLAHEYIHLAERGTTCSWRWPTRLPRPTRCCGRWPTRCTSGPNAGRASRRTRSPQTASWSQGRSGPRHY